MKTELFDKWIADLRSGKHSQARGALYDSSIADEDENDLFDENDEPLSGWCCLGRLSEVMEHPRWCSRGEAQWDEETLEKLPTDIAAELFPVGDFQSVLACLNDGNRISIHTVMSLPEHVQAELPYDADEPWSFVKIADFLELHREWITSV